MAKTFNHNTILIKDEQGNWKELPAIVGEGGGSGGTSNYNQLSNKPKINNVELSGNKSLADLGIQASGDYATKEYVKDSYISYELSTGKLYLKRRDGSSSEIDLYGYLGIANKVDKVIGKSLSSNDYTDAEKTKLSGLSNYDDTMTIGEETKSVKEFVIQQSNDIVALQQALIGVDALADEISEVVGV